MHEKQRCRKDTGYNVKTNKIKKYETNKQGVLFGKENWLNCWKSKSLTISPPEGNFGEETIWNV